MWWYRIWSHGIPNASAVSSRVRIRVTWSSAERMEFREAPSLSEGSSRTSMHSALDQVARILTDDEETDAWQIPWNQLRYEHITARPS